tara:strand:+ start:570 stop:1238 length:669 start_codon:yes stop_codon:yes gene_type:complete
MSNYFRRLPNLDYPSLLNSRESNTDYVQTKNLFRRVKIREDLFSNFMQFDRYKVQGDERPDTVSENVYGKSTLDWVILLSNNIIDIKNEWPLTQLQLNEFLNEKYTPQELVSIHHYETLELRDNKNQLILPAGITVDEDFNMEYMSGNQIRSTNSLVDGRPIKAVTFFDHENELNDRKRNINVLKPEFLGVFIKEFERIMKYEKSSQYVNRKLKKTENPRIK